MALFTDPGLSNPVLTSLQIKSEDKIIFIKENGLADSNFIITHLFKQLLYQKCRICFLMLHNSFNHYYTIGKKLGYDLRQMVNSGEVKVIDPLEEVLENIGQQLEANSQSQLLNCIYSTIKKDITSFQSIGEIPIYLVIDDLSHLLDLGIRLSDTIDFTNHCLNLTSDENIFIIINSHVCSQSDLVVANNIQYACNVFICVSPLKTGRSTDITGVMTIERGEKKNKYHYKAFDRGVKTFHPGDTIYNLYK